jgi:hypothetical protein
MAKAPKSTCLAIIGFNNANSTVTSHRFVNLLNLSVVV